jgi:tRNA-Thr(GGU) m(6)t(6)A37 methyltransferase TsaA
MKSDFPTKFGIPRQSGLVSELHSTIIFEPEYRNSDALRGLEGFSHLWLIWQFSEAVRSEWSPTVRPPRLGGNTRVGVFASRSPFRPNPIGLSCVKLLRVEERKDDGLVLIVSGADLLDGTPVLDIKPYIPFADCITDAVGGYATAHEHDKLQVHFPNELLSVIIPDKRAGLLECLADDPRPSYQDDPDRVYGMVFGEYEIKFTVQGGVLMVIDAYHL